MLISLSLFRHNAGFYKDEFGLDYFILSIKTRALNRPFPRSLDT